MSFGVDYSSIFEIVIPATISFSSLVSPSVKLARSEGPDVIIILPEQTSQ